MGSQRQLRAETSYEKERKMSCMMKSGLAEILENIDTLVIGGFL